MKAKLLITIILGFLAGSLHATTGHEAFGISAEEALRRLKEGNARYVSGKQTFPNLTQARRDLTSGKGQHPFATVLGCSDSRVPAEYIFDAGIGDLFIVRVAGNVCDTDEIGSIEYGTDHLGTRLLVILGHTGCGAVTAVVKGDEVHGSIVHLVDNIIPAAEKAKMIHGNKFSNELVNIAIKLNVWQSMEDLFRRSPVAMKLVRENRLKVVGAVYHIDSGEVEWLGEHPQQARLLTDSGEIPMTAAVSGILSLVFFFVIIRTGKK